MHKVAKLFIYSSTFFQYLIAQEMENALNSMDFCRSFICHKFYITKTIFFLFKKWWPIS